MSSRCFKPSAVLTDSALSTAAPLALGLRALQATDCTEFLPSQQQETCITKLLRPTMSAEATKRVLRRRAVDKPSAPVTTTEAKFDALARFTLAFNPSPQAIAFTQKVVATVRESALLRDPAQPAYEKFINQQAAMMHGGPAHSMPTLLQSQQGYGFVLASPTGVGRSAYLQRLHVYLGTSSHLVHPHADASTQLIFVPMLLVMWPTCGTMRGFLLAIRDALSVAIGSSVGSQILKNFTGRNGPQVAISVCIFFNVGLLTIDGACMSSLRGEYPQILEFVSRFQRQTGIPTLISCTYPMAQIISRGGGNGQNLSNVAAEYWDLLPMGKQWASYCEFFWNIGMVGEDVKMPSYLVGNRLKLDHRFHLKLTHPVCA